jgi:hypothetical protein
VVSTAKIEDARAIAIARRTQKKKALFFCQHAETVEAVATAPYFDWISEKLRAFETRPFRSPCAQR